MTPLQAARKVCANFGLGVQRGNSCIWVNPCLLVDGKRCEYFERCILPLEKEPTPFYKGFFDMSVSYRVKHGLREGDLPPRGTKFCHVPRNLRGWSFKAEG